MTVYQVNILLSWRIILWAYIQYTPHPPSRGIFAQMHLHDNQIGVLIVAYCSSEFNFLSCTDSATLLEVFLCIFIYIFCHKFGDGAGMNQQYLVKDTHLLWINELGNRSVCRRKNSFANIRNGVLGQRELVM